MDANDDYLRALRRDAGMTDAYHRRAIEKTEQQRALEELLERKHRLFPAIADIACGGGALTYHLRSRYPDAMYTLCDGDPEALRLAKELNGEGCRFVLDDIHLLATLPSDAFDLVCCWQTLSWLKQPEKAVEQLLRIAKPDGLVLASSLFNLDHDVDIRAQVRDRTRPSGEQGYAYDYNTYSRATVTEWLQGRAKWHTLHPFIIQKDVGRSGRGLGTHTVNTPNGRLQISGGLLMNWAILEIEK